MRVQPAGVEGDRHRHDDVALGSGCSQPGPSSTTSQQNSWPMTRRLVGSKGDRLERVGRVLRGQLVAQRQRSSPCCRRCRSLPQMPQASTLVSTWPDWGTGSGTSSTSSAHRRITAARIGRERRRGLPPGRHGTGPDQGNEATASRMTWKPASSSIDISSVDVGRRSVLQRAQVDDGHAARVRPTGLDDDVGERAGEQVGVGQGQHGADVVHRRADEAVVAGDVGRRRRTRAARRAAVAGGRAWRRRAARRSGVAWSSWVRSRPAMMSGPP